jgi:hypothetical protein
LEFHRLLVFIARLRLPSMSWVHADGFGGLPFYSPFAGK